MIEGESKIVKQAVAGDREAFGLLYDRYQPRIYRFVFLKLGRREDAEDVTHQVFMKAFQCVGEYADIGHPFGSWLYEIARNQIIDRFRAAREEVSLDEMADNVFPAPAEAAFALDGKFQIELVRKTLKSLRPEYQDVVIFRFVEELSLKETAAAMQKSVGAVKLLQHRAIQSLRSLIAEKTNGRYPYSQTI